MKKQILLYALLLLGTFRMDAQEILKKGLFKNTALGYCKTNSSVASVVVDQDKAQLRVFTYTRLQGSFNFDIKSTGEAPKNTKAKLGGFMKKMSETNKIYDANNKDLIGASCVSIRTLPFSYLMGEGLRNLSPNEDGIRAFLEEKMDRILLSDFEVAVAYPNLFKPDVNYSFSKPKCDQGQIDFGALPLLSVDQFYAKYPQVDYSNEKFNEIALTTQGEGLLGLKNIKSLFKKTEYHRCVDSLSAEVSYSQTATTLLKEKEVIAKLTGYYAAGDYNTLHLNGNNTYFNLLSAESNKEDKFANYKNFRFITFNEEGTILNTKDFKTEYLRSPRYCNFVYDKKGNPTGVLVILSSFTVIGGKSQKDPKDNNHVLYYFDLQGNEKFHYTFEHGEGDNPRAITPILVIDDNGKIRMWSANYDKFLKPITQIINFDDKGKSTFVNFPKDNIKGGYTTDINGPMSPYFQLKVLEDGNFLLWNQKTETKARQKGSFEEKYTVFNSAMFIIMTPDLEYVASSGYGSPNATIPASFEYIGKLDDSYKIIVTNQYRNHFESLGKENKYIAYPPMEEDKFIQLPPKPVVSNYTIDKANRKIYAIYEHKNWTMFGYAVILSY